ncbi:hypothetical protein F5Y18DRAFT_439904 [Xylariaceae sp. FL1019]|nr:hypothetical protein F5Y18DRAFT_439904 [Xylariaceae sp. FL1019]
MRIRYRAPAGVGSVELADNATVLELVQCLKSEINCQDITVKFGWPLQTLAADLNATTVCALGLQRELLTIAAERPSQADQSANTFPAPPSVPDQKPAGSGASLTDDSLKVAVPESGSSIGIAGMSVLRVMPDDGDCLFTAVSGALHGLLHPGGSAAYTPATLRRIATDHIRANPVDFNATTLEKSPEAYCQNMLRPGVWGGAIELGILAEVFRLEICTIDIANGHQYTFGEQKNYEQFCIIAYSGIHYDRVAEVLFEGQDNLVDFDVTRWSTMGNDHVLRAARVLCKKLRDQHYYTDTSNFIVTCNTCGELIQGERAVTEHARKTGHGGVTEVQGLH